MAQKIVIHSPGDWSHLIIEDFVCGDPVASEVKIKVEAAGVNFADTSIRQGLYSSAKEFIGWPITPGFEIAGTVLTVGSGVTGFKVGDRVFGVSFFGGYSSEIVVPEQYIRHIPKKLSFAQAASIPAVFMTSYYATQWQTNIHPGSLALVHSAGGGMGLALSQMLKASDCEVVGVVGTSKKVAAVKGYGVKQVIDKSKGELWSELEAIAPKGFDLIFDANGVSTLGQSYNHLGAGGILFVYGFHSMLSKNRGKRSKLLLVSDYLRTLRFNPFDMVKSNRSVVAFNVSYLYDRLDMLDAAFDYLLDGFEAETLRVLPIQEYKFRDVVQAHKDLESGKTTGKLILTFNK